MQMNDFDVYGVFVPALLLWMLVALALTTLVRAVLSWADVYRLVWHRSLFNASVYLIVLGIIVGIVR
nr:DUF1656 domain-containing protein [uncultured Cupriavidus sp.]